MIMNQIKENFPVANFVWTKPIITAIRLGVSPDYFLLQIT
jgi:hypothetical protein